MIKYYLRCRNSYLSPKGALNQESKKTASEPRRAQSCFLTLSFRESTRRRISVICDANGGTYIFFFYKKPFLLRKCRTFPQLHKFDPKMYSNKPRVIKTTTHNINHLPFEDLAFSYNTLVKTHATTLASARNMYIEDYKEKILAEFPEYKGDFSEYTLETKAAIKFPDKGRSGLGSELVTEFANKFSIPKNSEWVFGQMMARFAELPLVKNENGISAKALVLEQIKPSLFLSGCLLLCKHPIRSDLLDKQTSEMNRNYCSLVPLVMSAFKKYKGIAYTAWDRDEIHGITDPKLSEAMKVAELPEVTIEEVLEIRALSLTPKTGKSAGIQRNPATTYTLYTPKDTVLSSLPLLVRIMLCQTWCAHPSNRTPLMVLNPTDWDDMPDPLIDTNVTSTAREDDWTL